MPPVLAALCAWIVSLWRSHASLRLENLALRYQLTVYQQTVARPRLRSTDRLFWVWLSRCWAGWQEVLAFVQPRTVLARQRTRFRNHWRRLSQQGQPGRPAIAAEDRVEYDPQLQHREMFPIIDHPDLGECPYEGAVPGKFEVKRLAAWAIVVKAQRFPPVLFRLKPHGFCFQ